MFLETTSRNSQSNYQTFIASSENNSLKLVPSLDFQRCLMCTYFPNVDLTLISSKWHLYLQSIETLVENGCPPDLFSDSFWVQHFSKINAIIDAGQLRNVCHKLSQNGIHIDTQHSQKSMPKHVAEHIINIVNNHIF